jgi:hypothetical protein
MFHKWRGQRVPPTCGCDAICGCDIGVTPFGTTADVIPAGAIDSTAWAYCPEFPLGYSLAGLFLRPPAEGRHYATRAPTGGPAGDRRAAAGLPEGYGLRDLRHHFAAVLIFGGANGKTVQLAMGHPTPTVTLNTYVGFWPDAVDQTRTLVESAPGCTQVVPGRGAGRESAGQGLCVTCSS